MQALNLSNLFFSLVGYLCRLHWEDKTILFNRFSEHFSYFMTDTFNGSFARRLTWPWKLVSTFMRSAILKSFFSVMEHEALWKAFCFCLNQQNRSIYIKNWYVFFGSDIFHSHQILNDQCYNLIQKLLHKIHHAWWRDGS